MENKIVLDLNLLKFLLNDEAKRLVGKVCKRFELCEDKELIKREVKELIYEEFRNITNTLETGKIIFEFQSKDNTKKGE